jgi:hypothetical protein
VASGQTAVISKLDMEVGNINSPFLTIVLGNFPPNSKLILTAICSQKLEVQDFS